MSALWSACKLVRANKGSAGVDSISMEEFDADRSRHLYKLWKRMASGSYFPPPVKEVKMLKETVTPSVLPLAIRFF